jgi:transcriptional regulator with XRE-family HTH domain
MKQTIGDRIKEKRKTLGLTQLDLASKIGVTDRAVSKWEQGDGNPDVGILPSIASVLDVSLDYLLTGKQIEEKVIFASKMEVCAKNDDLNLFKEIECASLMDESKKTLMDYVIQYKSKKVFRAIMESQNPYGYLGERQGWKYWGIPTMLSMFIISGCIDLLPKINWNLENVEPKEYNNDSMDFVLSKDCPEATKDAVFSCKDKKNPKWNDILSEFLIRAVEINNEYGVSYMIGVFEKNNVAVPRACMDALAKAEKTELLVKASEYNGDNGFPTYPKKEIEVLLMKQDKTKTPEDVFVFSCLDSGILQIGKLLACKNTKLIEKTLSQYPITAYEIFKDLADKKDVKGLFRLCSDNNMVASYGMNGTVDSYEFMKDPVDYEKILKAVFKRLESDLVAYGPYSTHMPICLAQIQNDVYIRDKIMRNCHSGFSSEEELLAKTKECKSEIVTSLKLQDDKNRTTGDLTQEYFDGQMKAGNYEIVVVKLCTKFEAILKADYKKQGDFKEMLDSYCKDMPSADDGWGYAIENPMVPLLNKLRMKRNSVVHAEQSDVDLSEGELKSCIRYVLDIEKKEGK